MNNISADEYGFLGLFGKDPDRQGLDDTWFFDDSVYELSDGPLTLLFSVLPHVRDVRIVLRMDNRIIYDYSAMGVQDIMIKDGSIIVKVSNSESIWVVIKPGIEIKHGATNA